MWINNRIAKPLRKGDYRTLVEGDGLGNLKECKSDHFNGYDWDFMLSNSQFISFWWAEKSDYEVISERLEKEMENYESKM